MSAAPVTTPAPGPHGRARLSLVQAPATSISAFGFVLIIAVLIAVGLGGVLIVSTSVGAQAKDLTTLRRQAAELGYKSAALESQLQNVSSANALALRANALGMVPNPYPAFINLADGTVTGVARAVEGNEMPFLTGTRQAPVDTDGAAPTGQDAPPPATAPDASQNSTPNDLSAAGATGQEQQ